jgi:hypothetical protein
MNPIIIESKKLCKAISWFIPVGAITICPFVICENKNNKVSINHESIHVKQQLELLVIPFFIIYLFSWLFNLVKYDGDADKAYLNIVFEREAYANEDDLDYLPTRSKWSCFKTKP